MVDLAMMNNSLIECEHTQFTADVTADAWDDGRGAVVVSSVRCTGCGVHYYNARDARTDGVYQQVEEARLTALDAHRDQRVV